MKNHAPTFISSQDTTTSCPPQLSEKSIEIAQHLVECAKDKSTLEYNEIGWKVNMHHKSDLLFDCLSEISKLTYLKANVLLSVLVVRFDNGLPGVGFFNMAVGLRHDSNIMGHTHIFDIESKRVYEAYESGKLDFILSFND